MARSAGSGRRRRNPVSTPQSDADRIIDAALALVAAGNRVILMDFDLRKPDLGRVLGLQASRGLVSLLGSDRTLSDVLLSAPGLPPR